MSIRSRFTLLFTLILAITLTIFGIALYTVQAQDTINSLKNDISMSANRFSEAIQRTNSRPLPPPNITNIPPIPFDKFSNEQEFQFFSERELVRVLDIQGNLITSPFGREGDALPLSEEGLLALQSHQEWWEIATVSEDRMLIYSRSVVINSEVLNIVQVARPLTERDRALQSLATTLIFAGLFTVLVAFGIGWFFSGLTLQPIKRITQTAREIGEKRDFSKRVQHQGPNDEVGQLANTFNAMLSRLQDAFQKVEHSLEMQRNFVADVSHELRTPLTTLRGNLGLLLRKPPTSADIQEDILNDMVDESDRLIRLVNELLVMARADTGRNLANVQISISDLIEETCRQTIQMDAKRMIHQDIKSNLILLGDRDALKQILLIGLDNALKHSSSDIWVSARKVDSKIEIRVKDSGEGISPETLDKVFDRFHRVEDSPLLLGFGLGLSIAKVLVEKMSGNIQLKSELGKGSELILLFPAG
ncbi:MAG: HAMP domain-containing sensor histidine kinase [Anaerolineaceae bacterium]|nr:HAMP domain-containing sensor histidine kinase [Anaerolineaceae bacterium]